MKRIILSLTVIMVLGMMMSCNKHEDKRLTVRVVEGYVDSVPIRNIKVIVEKRKPARIWGYNILWKDSLYTDSNGEVVFNVEKFDQKDIDYRINVNPELERGIVTDYGGFTYSTKSKYIEPIDFDVSQHIILSKIPIPNN